MKDLSNGLQSEPARHLSNVTYWELPTSTGVCILNLFHSRRRSFGQRENIVAALHPVSHDPESDLGKFTARLVLSGM